MRVHSPRVLALSILIGAAVGAGLGALFATIGDWSLSYGVGTGWFVCAIGCAGAGLLGATEPAEGWASARRRHPEGGRQGVIARIAEDEAAEFKPIPSWPMAVWGIVVGGTLFGLAMAAFSLD